MLKKFKEIAISDMIFYGAIALTAIIVIAWGYQRLTFPPDTCPSKNLQPYLYTSISLMVISMILEKFEKKTRNDA